MRMYQERRKYHTTEEQRMRNQLAEWRWDSHLWEDHQHGRRCVWCGWVPPGEMPLEHAVLCMENPVIKERLMALRAKFDKAWEDLTKGGDKGGGGQDSKTLPG